MKIAQMIMMKMQFLKKINEFQYLGAMLSVKNYYSKEIEIRITKNLKIEYRE